MAELNYDLFSLFAVGNFQLQSGNCLAARVTTKTIVSLAWPWSYSMHGFE